MAIHYHTEECGFRFTGRRKTTAWIREIIGNEGKIPGQINVVFCSDPYLLEMNVRYLKHDYYTDIITFDYGDGSTVSGDLFISVDTVRANAGKFGVDFRLELFRVIAHGVLHLCGYKDKTGEESRLMRKMEDRCLSVKPEEPRN